MKFWIVFGGRKSSFYLREALSSTLYIQKISVYLAVSLLYIEFSYVIKVC